MCDSLDSNTCTDHHITDNNIIAVNHWAIMNYVIHVLHECTTIAIKNLSCYGYNTFPRNMLTFIIPHAKFEQNPLNHL